MKRSLPGTLLWIAAWTLIAAGTALAQPYPNKPVRVIIPFGAGGSTDVLIRIVAARMPEGLGQQVVIDNRTGAGGMIGTDIAAKSNPDGYTLLGTGSPHAIFPHLYKSVPFHALNDFTPIMQIASQPYGLVVHPSLPVRSVKDLIALAKKEPGKHGRDRRRARALQGQRARARRSHRWTDQDRLPRAVEHHPASPGGTVADHRGDDRQTLAGTAGHSRHRGNAARL
jgi:tripartite-type tricarboxylate transporter receptor subunit TctC